MAILLTKNYQEISNSEAYYGSTRIGYLRLYAKYNSQNKANAQTECSAKLTFELSSPYTDVTAQNVSSNLVGETKSFGTKTFYRGEITLQEENFTINHYSDGTSREYGVTGGFSSSVISADGVGWHVTAPKIDRYPILTNAEDFNDEANPTIQYTTILGFEGASVETCIASSDGSVIYAGYRAVNVDNGSYTFELTNAERETLRNSAMNTNTLPIRFYLKTTTTNNVEYYSYIAKTLTIVNANPTQTTAKLETTPTIVALLGDSADKVVQNASKVRFTITPTAQKGASISSVTITHNGIAYTKTASPYTFDINVINGNFNILVTDSRGNKNGTNGENLTLTLIEYIPVNITKCNLVRVNPTSSDVTLNLEADYKQTNFNSTANAPIIKWRLKNGTYATIPSSYYTIDTTNNKVIVNYTIVGQVAYTTNGYFDIYIEDKITTDVESDKLVLKGVAVFERGEHDVQVNGDLFVADTNRQNKVNVLEAINEASLDIYTTTERAVGVWVDDRVIYQKTIYLSSLPNETAQTYNFSTFGITLTKVIDVRGMAYASNGAMFVINGARESFNGVIGIRFGSSSVFTIQTGQDRSNAEAYITFWYLKD